MVPYNPHIKYYEGDRRGYFKAELTRSHAQFDLRFVTSVERPNGTGYWLSGAFVDRHRRQAGGVDGLSHASSRGLGASALARRANSGLASARTSATRAASHPSANQAAGSGVPKV